MNVDDSTIYTYKRSNACNDLAVFALKICAPLDMDGMAMLVSNVPWDSTNREKTRRLAEHVQPIERPSQPEPVTMRTVVSTYLCDAAGNALRRSSHQCILTCPTHNNKREIISGSSA